MATLPSGKIDFEDYVRYAKFYLCSKTKTLTKDPIWDQYTDVEIMVEFFAHQFESNKKLRDEFEVELGTHDSAIDSFASEADKMFKTWNKEKENILGGLENSIKFDPNDVLGE